MRCKRHPSDLSSGVGICASCLRERLFTLLAAQARQQALAQAQAEAEDRRKFNARPTPLIFPRSVSPYIYNRSASDPSWEHHDKFDQRFHNTPQVGPTTTTTTTTTTGTCGTAHKEKKKRGKFSLFAFLFGKFRSEQSEPDGTNPRTSRVSRSSLATSSSSSPISQTSFSALFPSPQKKKKLSRLFTFEDPRGRGHLPRVRKDRGMSPERSTVEGELYGNSDDSSNFSSKCSPDRREHGLQPQATPSHATPTRARRRGHNSRNMSGLAVCFSPLVRPSPSRQHRNMGFSGEIGFSGDIRASSKSHFSKNRSKKLADIGRYHSFNT